MFSHRFYLSRDYAVSCICDFFLEGSRFGFMGGVSELLLGADIDEVSGLMMLVVF